MEKTEKLGRKKERSTVPAPAKYKTIEEASAAKCNAMKKTLQGIDMKKLSELISRESVN